MRFVVFFSVFMLIKALREIAGLPYLTGVQQFAVIGISAMLVLRPLATSSINRW